MLYELVLWLVLAYRERQRLKRNIDRFGGENHDLFRRYVADVVRSAASRGTLHPTQVLQLVNRLKQKSIEEGSGIIQSGAEQHIFIGEVDFTLQDATFMLSLVTVGDGSEDGTGSDGSDDSDGDEGGEEGNAGEGVTHRAFTTFVLDIRSMLNKAEEHSAMAEAEFWVSMLTMVLGLFHESFEIDLCNGDIDEDRPNRNDTKVVPIRAPRGNAPEPQSKEDLTTLTQHLFQTFAQHDGNSNKLILTSPQLAAMFSFVNNTCHPHATTVAENYQDICTRMKHVFFREQVEQAEGWNVTDYGTDQLVCGWTATDFQEWMRTGMDMDETKLRSLPCTELCAFVFNIRTMLNDMTDTEFQNDLHAMLQLHETTSHLSGSPTPPIPTTPPNNDTTPHPALYVDEDETKALHRQAMSEMNYHEHQLENRSLLRRRKSMRRTSIRLEERKKLKSSNFLRQIPMFGKMDATQFKAVVDAMEYMEFQDDQLVLLQGTEADQFCVLTQGHVEIFVKNSEHDQMTNSVGRKSAPWYFGEKALVARKNGDIPTRTATIRTRGFCRMMTLSYDTFTALQQQGVVHGGDIEEEMLARETHWAQVNAERRQTESEYGTYEKHGVSTVDIENNANGVDLDSRLVAKKDTMDVSHAIDAAGSAAANDAAALESSDLLIAHEAIHQHHERRLSQQLLQRQAMAGGKLLVRRKARNILKKSKLFSGFSMAVVTKIVEKMQLRKFPTGTRICIQKDEGTHMGRCGGEGAMCCGVC